MRSELLLATCIAIAPSEAKANFWDIYGFDPHALGMAGAMTAASDDFTGVHYNPASLTNSEGPIFGLGVVGARTNLALSFAGRDPRIAPLAPPNATTFSFGALFPISGESVRVSIGLAFAIPTRSLLNGQALDPAIPHWYIYHALPERLGFNVGVGVVPALEWLSLGIGVQLLASLHGSLDYELDVVAGRFSRKTVLFDIEPKVAPTAGIELRPIEGLRIGVGYRGAIEATVDLPVDLDLTALAELDVDTIFTVQYNPHQIAFGASYLLADLGLLLSADLTWSLWSRAPDPSVASRLDVGGELFEGAGLDEALDVPAPGQERPVDLGFRNVLQPRLGAEQRLGIFRLRAGYAVRPSPAPLQTSGTNYVDGTAHTASLGASAHWQDPWGLLSNPLIYDAGVALTFLPPRSHPKLDPEDPVGSYSASGTIWVFGFAIRYRFAERPLEGSAPRS